MSYLNLKDEYNEICKRIKSIEKDSKKATKKGGSSLVSTESAEGRTKKIRRDLVDEYKELVKRKRKITPSYKKRYNYFADHTSFNYGEKSSSVIEEKVEEKKSGFTLSDFDGVIYEPQDDNISFTQTDDKSKTNDSDILDFLDSLNFDGKLFPEEDNVQPKENNRESENEDRFESVMERLVREARERAEEKQSENKDNDLDIAEPDGKLLPEEENRQQPNNDDVMESENHNDYYNWDVEFDSFDGKLLPEEENKQQPSNDDEIEEDIDSKNDGYDNFADPDDYIDYGSMFKNMVKSAKEKVFKVVKTRKPKNEKKVKHSLIKATIAIALSVTTAIAAFGLFKANSDKNDEVIDNKTSSVKTHDDNDKNIVKSGLDNLISDDFKTKDSSVSKQKEKDVKSNQATKVDNKKTSVKENNNETLDIYTVNLGESINVSDDSKIYTNIYDAASETNGLNRYFSSDTTRYVEYMAFEYNGQVVYSNSEQEIELLKSNGAKMIAVGTSVEKNGACEGFYNSDDVVVLSKTL